jgi:hypothetical protein
MATAITPFGESFGDPRRYMGQSPLAEAGKAAKTFLTGYALKESGLTDYLNSLSKKQPQGAVAPSAPAATAIQPPQANVAPVMPVAPQGPATQGAAPMNAPTVLEMPPDIGNQILDGTWTGFPSAPTGPTSLKNPTDFNPLSPDASNQVAVSGNDYMNVPGYGKLQKIAGQFMGMG